MKSTVSTLFILLFCMLCMSCDDPEEFPARELGPFNKIQSNGGVKFKLVTGVENKVISTSISESMYSVSYGQLNINAPGGSMTVAIKDLDLLWCNACTVENPEPLIADTLNMYVHAGNVDLQDIHIAGYLGLSAINTGTYKFSGTAGFFNLYNVNSTSVEAFNLVTDSTYVNCWNSLGDTEIHATQVVNVFIYSHGSVYYKGNPPIVRLSNAGTGKLIKK